MRQSLLAALLIILAPSAVAALPGGWVTNDGTASKSLAVSDSGTVPSGSPPTKQEPAYKAFDGDVNTMWDAEVDKTDQSCWVVLDFGADVTIHAFAIVQRGDLTHDVKDHELLTGATKDGPWRSVGSYVGQECKPPAFSPLECRGKNQAGAAAFRQVFDLPSAATGRYFRWVAKTRYSEYQLFLYELEIRFSNWGVDFLLLLGIGSCTYLLGGVAAAAKTQGKPLRLGSHPHLPQWAELHGLFLDGLGFAHGIAVGRSARRGRAIIRTDGGGPSQILRKRGSRGEKDGNASSKRKQKKEKKKGMSGKEQASSPPQNPMTDLLLAPAPAPPAVGTVAGGGGRWVRVPD